MTRFHPTGPEPDDVVISAARSSADISGGPRLRLWGSCPGGLEREAAGELHALGWGPLPLPVRDDIPSGLHHDLVWERGSVYGTGDLASVYRTLWAGRVVSRVVLLLGVARIDSLREVEEVIRGLHFSWLPTASFAIRTERTGEHSFRSPDVGRVAGQAVIDAVRATTGRRLPVNLDAPEMEIRVELAGPRLRVGLELVPGSLHRRPFHRHRHMAALKATVAAGLLRVVGFRSGDRLLDPMCGGATIPVEAGLAARARPLRSGATERLQALGLHEPALAQEVWSALESTAANAPPPPPILGLDVSPVHVVEARANVQAAGLEDTVEIRRGDATRISGMGRVDRIIMNPPYGLRAGRPSLLRTLYSGALTEARRHLAPGGRIVLLSPALRVVRKAAHAADLAVEATRSVSLGKLTAVAFLLRPA